MKTVSKPSRKHRLRQWSKDLILLAAILLIVIFPSPAYRAALRGMELFLFTVAPGLIPFLILCPLFLRTRLFQRISAGFSRVSARLFRCDGACGPIFLMGCLSGYPAGARFVRDAYASGQITWDDSVRALCFCNVCGPLFMLGAVGVGMFGHAVYGWILTLSHYAAAILTGVIMARIPVHQNTIIPPVNALTAALSYQGVSFLTSLGASVKNAMQTMLLVGGYIILGSVSAALADACRLWDGLYALIRPIASLFGIEPELFEGIGAGLIEISGGCMGIAGTSSPIWVRIVLCALVIGFSGLAIIGQTTALWEGKVFPLGRYLAARTIHAGTAALLSGLTAWLLPLERLAVETYASPPARVSLDGGSYILLCLLLIGFIALMIKKKTR